MRTDVRPPDVFQTADNGLFMAVLDTLFDSVLPDPLALRRVEFADFG
jgi:hypothetical protein